MTTEVATLKTQEATVVSSIEELKSEDTFISEEIEKLKTEDSEIWTILDSIISDSNTEFKSLDQKDIEIRESIDTDKPEIDSEVNTRRETINAIDIEKINDDIADLKSTDESIKEDTEGKKVKENEWLDGIENTIDDEDITTDISKLKTKDIDLNNQLTDITDESNAEITNLEAANTTQTEKINGANVDIES